MTHPNILLITADQFRADAMSAAGHSLVRTPHLDRLAEDGVRFTQHYSQCPPCGPSRTSLLTGMYQMNHRSVQNGTPLDAAFTNIAELVRTARYTPWLIGYTDSAMDPRRLHPKDPRAGRYEELLPGILPYAPGSELAIGFRALVFMAPSRTSVGSHAHGAARSSKPEQRARQLSKILF